MTVEAGMEQKDWEWPLTDRQDGHRDRGARGALLRTILYEMTIPLEEPVALTPHGKVLSLNISNGGMLVLMDQSPAVGQVLKVQVPTPLFETETPTLAEVRWTRKLPFEQPNDPEAYFVGLKFMF
jgi:PilZ domain